LARKFEKKISPKKEIIPLAVDIPLDERVLRFVSATDLHNPDAERLEEEYRQQRQQAQQNAQENQPQNQLASMPPDQQRSYFVSLSLQCARIRVLENLELLGPRLVKLALVANCVRKLEGLDKLVNLEHLELYQNQIKRVENLGKLRNLRVLDLSFNKIREVEYLVDRRVVSGGVDRGENSQEEDHLPFRNKLRKLYLTNNKLKDIPANSVNSFPNLELLELGANKLRTTLVEDEEEGNTTADNVNADSTNSSPDNTTTSGHSSSMQVDPTSPPRSILDGLTNLKELWMGKNKIVTMYLPPLPALEKVAWQANRLEEWDGRFFRNCPNVTHLYFSKGEIKYYTTVCKGLSGMLILMIDESECWLMMIGLNVG
jgi:protein phosphatase 1 regulatory subunit 7